MEENSDLIPFNFKPYKQALKEMPYDKADDLMSSSNFLFFKNGLWTPYDIRKFLKAHDRNKLEFFAVFFAVEPLGKNNDDLIKSIMDSIIVV